MKKLQLTLKIIIALSLCLSPYATLAQGQQQGVSDEERYVYLEEVAYKVESTLRANVATLGFYKKCFQGSKHSDCAVIKTRIRNNIRIKYPSLQHIAFQLSILGADDPVRQMQSIDTLFRLFESDLLNDTKKFNIPASMYADPFKSPLSKVESLSHLPRIRFSREDIDRIMKDKDFTFKTHNKDGKVIKEYPLHPNGLLQMVCENTIIRAHKKGRIKNYSASKYCSNFDLRYHKETNKFAFFTQKQSIRGADAYIKKIGTNGINAIAAGMRPRPPKNYGNHVPIEHPIMNKPIRVLKKILEKRFFDTMTPMPYIALVPSANPTNAQIAEAFNIMRKGAIAELEEVSKNYRRAFQGEEAPLSKGQAAKTTLTLTAIAMSPAIQMQLFKGWVSSWFKSDDRTEEEKLNVEVNWYRALNFLAYGALAESLIDDPSERMFAYPDTDFETVYADSYNRFSSNQTWDLMTDLGLAIGLTAACVIPIGRGLHLGGKLTYATAMYAGRFVGLTTKAARLNYRALLCIPGTTLAVNYMFYSEAERRYESVYRRIFSTLEGQVLLAELRELSQAESDMVLEMILFLGTGALGGLRHLSTKLSSRSINYLKSVL